MNNVSDEGDVDRAFNELRDLAAALIVPPDLHLIKAREGHRTRWVPVLATAVVVTVIFGGVTAVVTSTRGGDGGRPATSPSSSAAATGRDEQTCGQDAVTRFAGVKKVTDRTGVQPALFRVVNHGQRDCILRGFPNVKVLLARTKPHPESASGDLRIRSITATHPGGHGEQVRLRPDAAVTVTVSWTPSSDSRCWGGPARITSVLFTLPGHGAPQPVSVAPKLGLCRGDVVHTSSFQSALRTD